MTLNPALYAGVTALNYYLYKFTIYNNLSYVLLNVDTVTLLLTGHA